MKNWHHLLIHILLVGVGEAKLFKQFVFICIYIHVQSFVQSWALKIVNSGNTVQRFEPKLKYCNSVAKDHDDLKSCTNQ